MTHTALVLFGHGSRDEEGARELLALTQCVAAAARDLPVTAGVLEFHGLVLPSIQEAVAEAVRAGNRRLLAQPVLLLNAGHSKRDMPAEMAEARRRFPDVELIAGRAFGPHPVLLDIVRDRVREALAPTPALPPEQVGVLLVGRGSYDPEANADLCKVARLLWETSDFGFVEPAFISLTHPFVAEGIGRLSALGARRIVVVPYFMNTGTLVKRIRSQAEAAGSDHPGREIVLGGHMGLDPRLVQVILDEAQGRLRPPFPPGRREPWDGSDEHGHHHGHHHHHHHDGQDHHGHHHHAPPDSDSHGHRHR